MIQRIQSIYLFLASLALFALYLFPLAHHVYINGVPSLIKVTGVYQDVNGIQAHPVVFVAQTILTAAVALLPLAIIFFYKRRKQQIALCYSTILVIIGLSFWLARTTQSVAPDFKMGTNNFGMGIMLMPIAIILVLLAAKAIKRDEKLIKSADRLR